MRAWPRVVVVAVIAMMAGRAGAASQVTSYAYVTATDPDWNSPIGGDDTCVLTVRIPAAPLDAPPAHATEPAAMPGTTATARVEDPDRICFDYLRTWQRASFDPGDPTHARVSASRRWRNVFDDLTDWGVGITFGLFALVLIAERFVKWRQSRRR